MSIETIAIKDRASWLKLREKDVTASVAGALLGVHDYATAYSLWALKSGRLSEDPEETPAMRRGRLLEPIAIELLGEDRPTWKVTAPRVYLRDPLARIGATPDAYAIDPDRSGFGVVQIKTTDQMIFRRKWRDADTDEVTPPLWIAVQAIVEAHLAGANWAAVAVLTNGMGLDLHVVDVPIHVGILIRVRQAVAEFWQMIANGGEPDPDYGRDGDLIARLFASDNGIEIDLSGDNELPSLLDERAVRSSEKSGADARLKTINAELLAKLGPAARARCADGRIVSAPTIRRKAYVVQESSYRAVRIKDAAPVFSSSSFSGEF